jgi:alpha-methylacyl-CoA racemase
VTGVLDGIRVLELGGIGPGPHAAMLLADMGADVVRVEREGVAAQMIGADRDFVLRNRRSVMLDLKSSSGRDQLLGLVERADVLVEGFRPGVTERLGVGPDECLARNPALVYGRITGWGQRGPFADRAGHDINFMAVSGALDLLPRSHGRPFPPLNLVADLGAGSLYLVAGVLAGLLRASRTGEGQVVDAAMIDGVHSLMAMYWMLSEQGEWSVRGRNMTDGAAPFYQSYECADGRYIVVGAVEAPFYRDLLLGLGLDPESRPAQMDRSAWPEGVAEFAAIFRTRTQAEWVDAFAELDACLDPVLTLAESASHPHIAARNSVISIDGVRQPGSAPRFSGTAAGPPRRPRPRGADLAAVLQDWSR